MVLTAPAVAGQCTWERLSDATEYITYKIAIFPLLFNFMYVFSSFLRSNMSVIVRLHFFGGKFTQGFCSLDKTRHKKSVSHSIKWLKRLSLYLPFY